MGNGYDHHEGKNPHDRRKNAAAGSTWRQGRFQEWRVGNSNRQDKQLWKRKVALESDERISVARKFWSGRWWDDPRKPRQFRRVASPTVSSGRRRGWGERSRRQPARVEFDPAWHVSVPRTRTLACRERECVIPSRDLLSLQASAPPLVRPLCRTIRRVAAAYCEKRRCAQLRRASPDTAPDSQRAGARR